MLSKNPVEFYKSSGSRDAHLVRKGGNLVFSYAIWKYLGYVITKREKKTELLQRAGHEILHFPCHWFEASPNWKPLKHRWLVLSELVAPRPCFTCWSRVAPCGVAFITFSSNLSHGFRETSFLYPTAELFRAGKLHCQGSVGKPALPLPFLLHVGVNARCWSAGQPLMIAVIITMGTSYAASMP